jgi:hypothetical protein
VVVALVQDAEFELVTMFISNAIYARQTSNTTILLSPLHPATREAAGNRPENLDTGKFGSAPNVKVHLYPQWACNWRRTIYSGLKMYDFISTAEAPLSLERLSADTSSYLAFRSFCHSVRHSLAGLYCMLYSVLTRGRLLSHQTHLRYAIPQNPRWTDLKRCRRPN